MKLKKILIIILSVALLSCFAVSTFATDVTTVATIPEYGFYISPGEYVFDQNLSLIDNLVTFPSSLNFLFTFSNDSTVYKGISFYFGSSDFGNFDFYFKYSDTSLLVYRNLLWVNDSYRYITVLEGFYIYDIDFFQWWQSNVTRVDSGYDNNLLDGILSSFTFIGEWIAGAANAVTPMFWDGDALTVVGTLSVAGLSFVVVFLLIALVSSFMKFRS